MTSSDKNPVVASNELKRGEVWGETDPAVHWAGAFCGLWRARVDRVLDHRLRDRAG